MTLSPDGEALILSALMSARYISLHTSDPGDSGASEVAGGSYVRKAQGTFGQSGSNPTIASNSAIILFVAPTALWGTVTHFGIWSASTGGTFYGGYPLTVAKPLDVDDIVEFPIGTLQVSSD